MATQYYRVLFILATLFCGVASRFSQARGLGYWWAAKPPTNTQYLSYFTVIPKEPFRQRFGSCYNEPRRMK